LVCRGNGAAAKIGGIDNLELYTTEPETFWRALREAALAVDASWDESPDVVAISVGEDCRLYIHEDWRRHYVEQGWPPGEEPVPEEAKRLGPTMRDFLIDRHNRLVAEAFLVHVMSKVTGLIDLGDQDGQLVTTENFVAAVRGGKRDITEEEARGMGLVRARKVAQEARKLRRSLDNGRPSPRKLLRAVVARLLGRNL
jgi:hypothetical protein